jgi:hypothetical protein
VHLNEPKNVGAPGVGAAHTETVSIARARAEGGINFCLHRLAGFSNFFAQDGTGKGCGLRYSLFAPTSRTEEGHARRIIIESELFYLVSLA